MSDRLFDILDFDGDGLLTRADLHASALRLGWDWAEAPFFAVLDLLTLDSPLLREELQAILADIGTDPRGPYGKVLRRAPRPRVSPRSSHRSDVPAAILAEHQSEVKPTVLVAKEAALLCIDLQRSFTCGSWMRSFGPHAEDEVAPIRRAFELCAQTLRIRPPELSVGFTRCPFPPASYHWDDVVKPVIDEQQPYFIKPGNSALSPISNGYIDWLEELLAHGRRTLVIAGCTLNSCVRVTALDTVHHFSRDQFTVVVARDLCGARRQNFRSSSLFQGLSPVEDALRQMLEAGVEIVDDVVWI